MEQINKALRNFELILTEFAGIEKIMTEDRRLQFLKICKDAQRQANGAEKSYGNCNIPPVSGRVCFSPDCFYHDKTTDTCVGDYAKCTVKQTHR